jgi:hypothetical protein
VVFSVGDFLAAGERGGVERRGAGVDSTGGLVCKWCGIVVRGRQVVFSVGDLLG